VKAPQTEDRCGPIGFVPGLPDASAFQGKRTLQQYGYPPDMQKPATETIFETGGDDCGGAFAGAIGT